MNSSKENNHHQTKSSNKFVTVKLKGREIDTKLLYFLKYPVFSKKICRCEETGKYAYTLGKENQQIENVIEGAQMLNLVNKT